MFVICFHVFYIKKKIGTHTNIYIYLILRDPLSQILANESAMRDKQTHQVMLACHRKDLSIVQMSQAQFLYLPLCMMFGVLIFHDWSVTLRVSFGLCEMG